MTTNNGVLQCDMEDACHAPVTHLEDKGWVYCAQHAEDRRGMHRIRRLQPWELKVLASGEPLATYEPMTKQEYLQRKSAS